MAERLFAGMPAELRVAAWALGAMHAAALTVTVVVLAFLGGDLGGDLEELNTGVGLGLYAALWAVSLGATFGALRRIGHDIARPGRVFGAAALWGGFAGAAFLYVLGMVASLAALLDAAAAGKAAELTLGDIGVVMLLVTLIAVVGGGFAFVVGAIVGALTAPVDVLLLTAARAVAGRPGSPP